MVRSFFSWRWAFLAIFLCLPLFPVHPFSVDWNQIDSAQQKLTERYGRQKHVRDFASTTRYLTYLLALQEKETVNNKSLQLHESVCLTRDIIELLVNMSVRIADESRVDDVQDELSSLLSLVAALRIAREHISDKQQYFTTPQVAPVTTPVQPAQVIHQPPVYMPPPPPYTPYPVHPQQQMSPLEKFVGISLATVVLHFILRVYFGNVVKKKVDEIGSKDREFEKKLTELEKKIDDLEIRSEEISRLETLENEVSGLKSSVKQEALEEVERRYLADMRAAIDEILSETKQGGKDMKTRLKELTSEIQGFEQRISQLKSQLKTGIDRMENCSSTITLLLPSSPPSLPTGRRRSGSRKKLQRRRSSLRGGFHRSASSLPSINPDA